MKRALAFGMALMLAGCGEYSDGERVGTIQKFSRKGLVSKTWEGEMLLGGLRRKSTSTTDSGGNSHTSSSMVANVWEFTVEDPALVAKVKKLIDEGAVIRAHYRQEYMTHPFRTETGMFGPYFLISADAAD